jgi:hypothetical protein
LLIIKKLRRKKTTTIRKKNDQNYDLASPRKFLEIIIIPCEYIKRALAENAE